MSVEAKQALAQRAVACPGWRWMPGMRVVASISKTATVALRCDADDECDDTDGQVGWTPVGSDLRWLPDLDDPATLGCLLALVREAWGDPHIAAIAADTLWSWPGDSFLGWTIGTNGSWFKGDTEAEALVAALEAAP